MDSQKLFLQMFVFAFAGSVALYGDASQSGPNMPPGRCSVAKVSNHCFICGL